MREEIPPAPLPPWNPICDREIAIAGCSNAKVMVDAETAWLISQGRCGGGPVKVIVPALSLSRPSAEARLTSAEATDIAKGNWHSSVFEHPFTVEYGSFFFPCR
ncbi:MAG: hypothetical protein ACR2GA_04495 [Chloroflexota bacterium]